MNKRRSPSSFLGDLSNASDQVLTSRARRWKWLMWAFVALLMVFCFATVVEVFGLLGAKHKYLAWSRAFWILFCIWQIAMAAAYSRGYRMELNRRMQDAA